MNPDRSLDLFLSGMGIPAALIGKIEEGIRSPAPLLIEGETGTGKTYLAQLIHDVGPRAGKPFVPQNCAAIPEGVFESEVFGHTRGAFTGAVQARRGLIEAAHEGTLFLDEISELRAHHQAALLDVLDDQGRYRRIGSSQLVRADIRLISATNRNLVLRVRAGEFRLDLFFRCAVLRLTLPPLRERRNEIGSLARRLLESIARKHGAEGGRGPLPVPEVSPSALSVLHDHPLRGNLRDLEHALCTGFLRCNGGRIEPEHIRDVLEDLEKIANMIASDHGSDPVDSQSRLPVIRGGETRPRQKSRKPRYVPPDDQAEEQRMIRSALARTRAHKSQAARLLGMTRQTLHSRMSRLNMEDESMF